MISESYKLWFLESEYLERCPQARVFQGSHTEEVSFEWVMIGEVELSLQAIERARSKGRSRKILAGE